MGRIKKKGTAGQAKNFITRTQAVRKLQISLPDFRRLCIFKGIFPREPRNKRKASKSSTPSTTFYYTKDIQYLLHEPLLAKFREHKALAKKIGKALGRDEVGDAARLEKKNTPGLSLDHIIKERYPTFVDALRDLDDALSLLFLFANLPSISTVPPKTIAFCQRLCLEFEHYLITSHSLRKSFLSIKGIYYQATIQGQDILWLVPYKFVQRVTNDIDFRIMGTFVEFYTTLLGFVNFRLYTSIGLVYPPRFNAKIDEQGGELGAFTLEGKSIEDPLKLDNQDGDTDEHPGAAQQLPAAIQKLIDKVNDIDDEKAEASPETEQDSADQPTDAIDTFSPLAEDADILPQPQASSTETASLFAPFTFFLSRETPRQPLEFILRAFGCKRIGWDAVLGDGAFSTDEHDPSITHQVVDRPPLASLPETQVSNGVVAAAGQGGRIPGRIYVQPQWVWDSINAVKLQPSYEYGPGATLPPHLSPWVKPTKGAYDPTVPLEEQEREGEAEEAEGLDEAEEPDVSEADLEVEGGTSLPPTAELEEAVLADEHGMDVAGSDSASSSESEAAGSFAGFDDDDNASESESDTERVAREDQRELEAEALGLPLPLPSTSASASTSSSAKKGIMKNAGEEARKKAARKRREEEEELERRKMMMGRKKRKLVDKMLYSNKEKDGEAERLRAKKRKLLKMKG